MDNRQKNAIIIVVILGALSVTGSLLAEKAASKITYKIVKGKPSITNCSLFSDTSVFGLMGICGLVAAHIILRVETAHPFYTCGPPRLNPNIWFGMISWLTGSMAWIAFSYQIVSVDVDCDKVQVGIFLVAAMCTTVSMVTGIIFLATKSFTSDDSAADSNASIASDVELAQLGNPNSLIGV